MDDTTNNPPIYSEVDNSDIHLKVEQGDDVHVPFEYDVVGVDGGDIDVDGQEQQQQEHQYHQLLVQQQQQQQQQQQLLLLQHHPYEHQDGHGAVYISNTVEQVQQGATQYIPNNAPQAAEYNVPNVQQEQQFTAEYIFTNVQLGQHGAVAEYGTTSVQQEHERGRAGEKQEVIMEYGRQEQEQHLQQLSHPYSVEQMDYAGYIPKHHHILEEQPIAVEYTNVQQNKQENNIDDYGVTSVGHEQQGAVAVDHIFNGVKQEQQCAVEYNANSGIHEEGGGAVGDQQDIVVVGSHPNNNNYFHNPSYPSIPGGRSRSTDVAVGDSFNDDEIKLVVHGDANDDDGDDDEEYNDDDDNGIVDTAENDEYDDDEEDDDDGDDDDDNDDKNQQPIDGNDLGDDNAVVDRDISTNDKAKKNSNNKTSTIKKSSTNSKKAKAERDKLEAQQILDDPSCVTTAFLVRKALKHSYAGTIATKRVYSYKNYEPPKVHPVIKILDDMQSRDDIQPGWLRRNECKAMNRPCPKNSRSFLITEERELVLKLTLILKPIVHHSTSRLAYAWGITRNSVNNIIKRACQTGNLSISRKKRSDAGQTIENSSRKRKSVYTALFVFKKHKRQEHKGDKLSKAQLQQMWDDTTPDVKEYFNNLALAEAETMAGKNPADAATDLTTTTTTTTIIPEELQLLGEETTTITEGMEGVGTMVRKGLGDIIEEGVGDDVVGEMDVDCSNETPSSPPRTYTIDTGNHTPDFMKTLNSDMNETTQIPV